MKFFIPTISSSLFIVYKKKTLVGYISDLGGVNIFSRIYDDSCDVGFKVKSEKTGNIVDFSLVSEEKREGETICWKFNPIYSNNPIVNGVEVVIYND